MKISDNVGKGGERGRDGVNLHLLQNRRGDLVGGMQEIVRAMDAKHGGLCHSLLMNGVINLPERSGEWIRRGDSRRKDRDFSRSTEVVRIAQRDLPLSPFFLNHLLLGHLAEVLVVKANPVD